MITLLLDIEEIKDQCDHAEGKIRGTTTPEPPRSPEPPKSPTKNDEKPKKTERKGLVFDTSSRRKTSLKRTTSLDMQKVDKPSSSAPTTPQP